MICPQGVLKNSDLFLEIRPLEFVELWACPGPSTCSGKALVDLKFSPLDDLEALCKQEVKAKAELSTILVLKVCPEAYTDPLSKQWKTYWFQAFKEISV